MAEGRLANRVAIITGGASGIGKATAELFAEHGAKVVIGDLPNSEGEQVAKSIGGLFVATDVREAKGVEKLVATACEKFGGLDIMFNNAGIGIVTPLLETSEELYSNTVRIDLAGVFWGLKFAGKVMVAQKRGAILNTASVAGIRPAVGLSPCPPAKPPGAGPPPPPRAEFAHPP